MKTAILITFVLIGFVGIVPGRAQSPETPDAFHVDRTQAATPSASPTAAAAAPAASTATASVVQDPRIRLLIEKQIYVNMLALQHMPGYRVQVISTMNRDKANTAKAKLMELFPQYKTYLSYQSPYFRVRIGDFRSQQDAEQLQQTLNQYFPNGVFTVRDVIHLTPEQLLENLNNDPEN